MSVATDLAAFALEIGALRIAPHHPFTWASGYRMPLYNDNRLLMRYPRGRELVRDGFAELLARRGLTPRIVAGTASAGIAPATLLAEAMGAELLYVRSQPKDHGTRNRIEGLPADWPREPQTCGPAVLLVEDLISTGGSSAAAATALTDAGFCVPLCVAIFSYGFSAAAERFAALTPAVPLEVILDFETLLIVALERDAIAAADLDCLRRWRLNPLAWGERRDAQ